MHILGPIGLVWAKNPDFLGEEAKVFTGKSKSFGTHITENHLGTLFAWFLVGHGTKWAKNANI